MLEILAAQIVVLRAQIGGLQAQVDALAAVVQEALEQQRPPEPLACAHLETENVGTFGSPQVRCTACKQLVAA